MRNNQKATGTKNSSSVSASRGTAARTTKLSAPFRARIAKASRHDLETMLMDFQNLIEILKSLHDRNDPSRPDFEMFMQTGTVIHVLKSKLKELDEVNHDYFSLIDYAQNYTTTPSI